ncbi:MAG: hypothetical protein U5L08_16340 [Xanthomonadales bacterium]|nr:hypothetical protein [Xanthomonadales bacterium]
MVRYGAFERGERDPQLPFLAREVGINRYQRITGFDFSAGDAYWEAASGTWSLVRDASQ